MGKGFNPAWQHSRSKCCCCWLHWSFKICCCSMTHQDLHQIICWMCKFCRNIQSQDDLQAQTPRSGLVDEGLLEAAPIGEILPAILKCSMPAFLNRLAQARAYMAVLELQPPGSGSPAAAVQKPMEVTEAIALTGTHGSASKQVRIDEPSPLTSTASSLAQLRPSLAKPHQQQLPKSKRPKKNQQQPQIISCQHPSFYRPASPSSLRPPNQHQHSNRLANAGDCQP